jgi:hypothetical protein
MGLTYHAKQFNRITIIVAYHFLDKLEPETAVNSNIGNVATGFQIALHILRVGLIGDHFHHGSPYALALSFGQNDHDIEEVVAARVVPNI